MSFNCVLSYATISVSLWSATCGSIAPLKWLSGFEKIWNLNLHWIIIIFRFIQPFYEVAWKIKRYQRFVASHLLYILEDEAEWLLVKKSCRRLRHRQWKATVSAQKYQSSSNLNIQVLTVTRKTFISNFLFKKCGAKDFYFWSVTTEMVI